MATGNMVKRVAERLGETERWTLEAKEDGRWLRIDLIENASFGDSILISLSKRRSPKGGFIDGSYRFVAMTVFGGMGKRQRRYTEAHRAINRLATERDVARMFEEDARRNRP